MKYIERVVTEVIDAGAWKATKYVSLKQVVRATQRRYGGRLGKRDRADIVLTIGSPNFSERRFIAKCKKAGEPFPVKKIQLKFPPRRTGTSA